MAVDSLSPRASAVRLSLGVPQKKLLECSPLSIVIAVDNVSSCDCYNYIIYNSVCAMICVCVCVICVEVCVIHHCDCT